MLVKAGRVAADPFTTLADGDSLPDGPAIVSLKRFLTERGGLLARAHPLGVSLETGESPEALGGDVGMLALVVLHVPYFRDGRAFSAARVLRTRLGFRGEIRVTGHVLIDQLAFYARVGVDAFDLTQNVSPAAVDAAIHAISQVYQPSVDGRPTIWDLRAAQNPPLASS